MKQFNLFAHIIQQFLPSLRQRQSLSPQQASSCQNILNCHTSILGGLDYQCDECHHHSPRYHSCRHRHCPQCQQKASALWVEKQMDNVLPLNYFHLVFTLPHELNGWAKLHPAVIYHLLFKCAWQTLNDYSKKNNQLQGKLGMTCVLHTWGQNLMQHNHLHCLIPGGAMNGEHAFITSRREYLYPHRALAKLFRGKMVSALRCAWKTGELHRVTDIGQVDETLNTLMQKDWVINTKPHLSNPETIVRYLGRYTYRTAISLSRIHSVDNTSVRFKWLDYRDNQKKIMTLDGSEFLSRFLLHILPKGFMRVRHFGYLANRVRVKSLQSIRESLKKTSMIAVKQTAILGVTNKWEEDKPETCPKCKTGLLHLVGKILSEKERRQNELLYI
ncbi:MAG: IS91 family transposase [Woeseiaceae bacterium]